MIFRNHKWDPFSGGSVFQISLNYVLEHRNRLLRVTGVGDEGNLPCLGKIFGKVLLRVVKIHTHTILSRLHCRDRGLIDIPEPKRLIL